MSEENASLQREAQKKTKAILYFQGQVEVSSIIGDDSQDQGAQDRAQGEDGLNEQVGCQCGWSDDVPTTFDPYSEG